MKTTKIPAKTKLAIIAKSISIVCDPPGNDGKNDPSRCIVTKKSPELSWLPVFVDTIGNLGRNLKLLK
jgi:hypothetical protein